MKSKNDRQKQEQIKANRKAFSEFESPYAKSARQRENSDEAEMQQILVDPMQQILVERKRKAEQAKQDAAPKQKTEEEKKIERAAALAKEIRATSSSKDEPESVPVSVSDQSTRARSFNKKPVGSTQENQSLSAFARQNPNPQTKSTEFSPGFGEGSTLNQPRDEFRRFLDITGNPEPARAKKIQPETHADPVPAAAQVTAPPAATERGRTPQHVPDADRQQKRARSTHSPVRGDGKNRQRSADPGTRAADPPAPVTSRPVPLPAAQVVAAVGPRKVWDPGISFRGGGNGQPQNQKNHSPAAASQAPAPSQPEPADDDGFGKTASPAEKEQYARRQTGALDPMTMPANNADVKSDDIDELQRKAKLHLERNKQDNAANAAAPPAAPAAPPAASKTARWVERVDKANVAAAKLASAAAEQAAAATASKKVAGAALGDVFRRKKAQEQLSNLRTDADAKKAAAAEAQRKHDEDAKAAAAADAMRQQQADTAAAAEAAADSRVNKIQNALRMRNAKKIVEDLRKAKQQQEEAVKQQAADTAEAQQKQDDDEKATAATAEELRRTNASIKIQNLGRQKKARKIVSASREAKRQQDVQAATTAAAATAATAAAAAASAAAALDPSIVAPAAATAAAEAATRDAAKQKEFWRKKREDEENKAAAAAAAAAAAPPSPQPQQPVPAAQAATQSINQQNLLAALELLKEKARRKDLAIIAALQNPQRSPYDPPLQPPPQSKFIPKVYRKPHSPPPGTASPHPPPPRLSPRQPHPPAVIVTPHPPPPRLSPRQPHPPAVIVTPHPPPPRLSPHPPPPQNGTGRTPSPPTSFRDPGINVTPTRHMRASAETDAQTLAKSADILARGAPPPLQQPLKVDPWETHQDEKGHNYYWNPTTGQSSWVDPHAMATSKQVEPVPQEEEDDHNKINDQQAEARLQYEASKSQIKVDGNKTFTNHTFVAEAEPAEAEPKPNVDTGFDNTNKLCYFFYAILLITGCVLSFLGLAAWLTDNPFGKSTIARKNLLGIDCYYNQADCLVYAPKTHQCVHAFARDYLHESIGVQTPFLPMSTATKGDVIKSMKDPTRAEYLSAGTQYDVLDLCSMHSIDIDQKMKDAYLTNNTDAKKHIISCLQTQEFCPTITTLETCPAWYTRIGAWATTENYENKYVNKQDNDNNKNNPKDDVWNPGFPSAEMATSYPCQKFDSTYKKYPDYAREICRLMRTPRMALTHLQNNEYNLFSTQNELCLAVCLDAVVAVFSFTYCVHLLRDYIKVDGADRYPWLKNGVARVFVAVPAVLVIAASLSEMTRKQALGPTSNKTYKTALFPTGSIIIAAISGGLAVVLVSSAPFYRGFQIPKDEGKDGEGEVGTNAGIYTNTSTARYYRFMRSRNDLLIAYCNFLTFPILVLMIYVRYNWYSVDTHVQRAFFSAVAVGVLDITEVSVMGALYLVTEFEGWDSRRTAVGQNDAVEIKRPWRIFFRHSNLVNVATQLVFFLSKMAVFIPTILQIRQELAWLHRTEGTEQFKGQKDGQQPLVAVMVASFALNHVFALLESMCYNIGLYPGSWGGQGAWCICYPDTQWGKFHFRLVVFAIMNLSVVSVVNFTVQ